MNTLVITLLLTGSLLALAHVLSRWHLSRIADRLVNEALHPERYPGRVPAKLEPESQFIVRVSDDAVSCERPDGQVDRMAWADLRRVEILTNSDGPLLPDAFWVLSTTDFNCVIPWGATGEGELLNRLQQLADFDNKAVLDAGTKERLTLCWQKPGDAR